MFQEHDSISLRILLKSLMRRRRRKIRALHGTATLLAAQAMEIRALQTLIDAARAELSRRDERGGPSASVTIDRSVVVGTNTAGVDNTSVDTSGGDYAEGEIRK